MISTSEAARLRSALSALGAHGARIKAIAGHLATLYDVAGAVAWIKAPQPSLGGKIPAALMQTEDGAHQVEALLKERLLIGS